MAYMIVSIHAPVRVRRTYRRAFLAEGSFNPRTREGATRYCRGVINDCMVSIHAPVRVRPSKGIRLYSRPGFNPRTREGATSSRLNDFYLGGVSIHAPVRVRLSPLGQEHGSPEVSIHAPVRVRQFIAYGVLEMEEFQSTHP